MHILLSVDPLCTCTYTQAGTDTCRATGVEFISLRTHKHGPRIGLNEEAHTLAFVWDAGELPRRLMKGSKEMKESIKVTLFLQPALESHTHKRLTLHTDTTRGII